MPDTNYIPSTPEEIASRIDKLEALVAYVEDVAMETWELDEAEYDGLSNIAHALKGELDKIIKKYGMITQVDTYHWSYRFDDGNNTLKNDVA